MEATLVVVAGPVVEEASVVVEAPVVVGAVVLVAEVVFTSCPRPRDKPTDSEMKRNKSKEAKTTMFFLCQIIFCCAISLNGGLNNQ